MKIYIYIGIGGFFGAISRFWLNNVVPLGESGFYWGTFAANLLGSFLLALLLTLVAKELMTSEKLKTLLTTGFISSFTTFSTLNGEIFSLLQQGKVELAGIYALTTIIFGLLVCYLGVMVGRTFPYNRSEGGDES